MKLYGYWRSTSSWRVRIALHYKGVAFEYVPVNLLKGEQASVDHLGRNAAGAVPVLELSEGRRIAQSLAIIEYLEEAHPSPALLPSDRYLRARARQLAETVNSGIQPFQNLMVLKHVQERFGADEKAWARHWIERGLRAFDGLAAETAGQFSVGDQVSVADVLLVPQLFGARRFGVELSEFPRLLRIEKACEALDAFARARPEAQPDAVSS